MSPLAVEKKTNEAEVNSGVVDVTFIILTKNEEINIVDCLNSIRGFAKRVVVVDSGSTDNTCSIAREMGADVYVNPFVNYATQFNWGIDHTNIDTKWSFRLDADERLTPALCDELRKIIQEHDQDDVNGVSMEAWLYFMGRKIKHGCHNKRKIMLFKTGKARIENRKMDEHTVLSEGKSIYCKERFIHYDFKDLNHWINKMNWYATREMQDYYDFKNGSSYEIEGNDSVTLSTRKKKFGFYYKFPLFFRCWLLFIYNYIFKLGFLDGKEGFVYHYMYHRWYRTLVDAKILEQSITNKPFEETGDLK
ncbi:MAG: glycosyltransferase family 2 protein [Clostridia bacterium]|nr:glycosyltransferase family 2 protein [Clostridia bacterium]